MIGFTAMRAGAVLVLLASALAGVAEAQRAPPGARRPGYCTGGLFTLTAGQVKFHVSLDDTELEPAGTRPHAPARSGRPRRVVAAACSCSPDSPRRSSTQGRACSVCRPKPLDLLPLGTRVSDRRKVVGIVEVFDDFRT